MGHIHTATTQVILGTGFFGSHMVDRLIKDGHNVIVRDNLIMGKRRNVERWLGHPNFLFILHDVGEPIFWRLDLGITFAFLMRLEGHS